MSCSIWKLTPQVDQKAGKVEEWIVPT